MGTQTEDKLFRILSRTPYLEMRRVYNEFWRRNLCPTLDAQDSMFANEGWTHQDFLDAALKE